MNIIKITTISSLHVTGYGKHKKNAFKVSTFSLKGLPMCLVKYLRQRVSTSSMFDTHMRQTRDSISAQL